jgi:hypothetical protein
MSLRRPDKYPEIDPRAPGLYRRILDAAQEMRARQQTGVAIMEAHRRAARIASLAAINAREAMEEPVEKVVDPV